jgi:hypothetical protein
MGFEFEIAKNEAPKKEQDESGQDNEVMDSFYKKFFTSDDEDTKKISIEQLRKLKENGITTEKFLDYICKSNGLLLHGSIHEIADDKLRSSQGKIFASNKSAIAIMRSVYSNERVNLEYSYFISDKNPLSLSIHTAPNGEFVSKEKGFIYIISNDGFKNEPEGSWQFINKTDEIKIKMIIETEKSDFEYPVEIHSDL